MSERFAFGENWSDYSRLVDDKRIQAATANLQRLLPELASWQPEYGVAPSFLDIGCGSGIHALAAASLGARVTAMDIDPNSVRTTKDLALQRGFTDRIEVLEASILDWMPDFRFDIVYSWGVLHHTGNLWVALERAAGLLAPHAQSRFAIAVYRKTRACEFWKAEKRWYTRRGPAGQKLARAGLGAVWDLARLRSGVSPWAYRREYYKQRGMSVSHDLHDWLGGYPYESATPHEIRSFLEARSLSEVRSFVRREQGLDSGFYGSGCDEFVFAPSLPSADGSHETA